MSRRGAAYLAGSHRCWDGSSDPHPRIALSSCSLMPEAPLTEGLDFHSTLKIHKIQIPLEEVALSKFMSWCLWLTQQILSWKRILIGKRAQRYGILEKSETGFSDREELYRMGVEESEGPIMGAWENVWQLGVRLGFLSHLCHLTALYYHVNVS